MFKNTDILLEKRIKSQAKLIYFALSKFANNQGKCFLAYNTLSELTGLSVRTVINYMGELIETGWVVKQKRKLKDKNSFTSNFYFLPNLIRGDINGQQTRVFKDCYISDMGIRGGRMSDDKKVYTWLRLNENFFQTDAIEWLEEQENGIYYSHFYLKLCLKTLNTDGILIPYDQKKLAEITKTPFDTVKAALEKLFQIGLVELTDDKALFIPQVLEMVGK